MTEVNGANMIYATAKVEIMIEISLVSNYPSFTHSFAKGARKDATFKFIIPATQIIVNTATNIYYFSFFCMFDGLQFSRSSFILVLY